eukprot:gb/GECH01012593.1/.p1 GENE.gb/GECH01012593.1/~~gb/GECH01012593.1/.p1  ORF type:complete len:216 (+),score=40.65 gb/GECH01012593.1/:1-648(+)
MVSLRVFSKNSYDSSIELSRRNNDLVLVPSEECFYDKSSIIGWRMIPFENILNRATNDDCELKHEEAPKFQPIIRPIPIPKFESQLLIFGVEFLSLMDDPRCPLQRIEVSLVPDELKNFSNEEIYFAFQLNKLAEKNKKEALSRLKYRQLLRDIDNLICDKSERSNDWKFDVKTKIFEAYDILYGSNYEDDQFDIQVNYLSNLIDCVHRTKGICY